MTKLNEMDLEYAVGGCDHNNTKNTGRTKYEITPGKNDWGYHVRKLGVYTCKDCGETIYKDSSGNIVNLA